MLKTPVFWLLFVMMLMMSTGGHMVITQFTSFARLFGIDAKTTVVILGVTLAAIPTALTFDRITNGLSAPSSVGSRITSAARTLWGSRSF